MHDNDHRTTRVISVAAATLIALSCGTNYAYSAWAPQFAERLHLTATQGNVIGNAGNIGMYASGIPLGMIIDGRGPRWGVIIGAISLACGYFPLYSAYVKGPEGTPFAVLCLASFLTGMGSCSAFSASIKVCATNWPHHRGTATALPLSGFGLSAFAYTTIGGLAFPHDASHLLLLLSVGTFTCVSIGMLFLRMQPPPATYTRLSGEDVDDGDRDDANRLLRTNSRQSKASTKAHLDQEADITGVALLRSTKFWQLWIMLGLLCGVGLMTINNIGNDAKTLWHHWDDTASKSFIQQRQLIHVGILSLCSFLGRLLSGIGSDVMVKKYHSSRFWSLVVSSIIFTGAQVAALRIDNPNWLFMLSGLTGLAYGALFGVYPALVADAFGAAGMGINWGAMTMSPVVSGNVFNLIYGANLDRHSDHPEGGERVCVDGRLCYSDAYIVTLLASVIGVGWSLWCVLAERKARQARRKDMDLHQG